MTAQNEIGDDTEIEIRLSSTEKYVKKLFYFYLHNQFHRKVSFYIFMCASNFPLELIHTHIVRLHLTARYFEGDLYFKRSVQICSM
jgi:hypothetical protein